MIEDNIESLSKNESLLRVYSDLFVINSQTSLLLKTINEQLNVEQSVDIFPCPTELVVELICNLSRINFHLGILFGKVYEPNVEDEKK